MANFSIKLSHLDGLILSFLSLRVLLSIFPFPASGRLFVSCVCVVLCTSIKFGLPGTMVDSNSAIDLRDPSAYPVVQYVERYNARLDCRWLAASCLSGDVKDIWDVRT